MTLTITLDDALTAQLQQHAATRQESIEVSVVVGMQQAIAALPDAP